MLDLCFYVIHIHNMIYKIYFRGFFWKANMLTKNQGLGHYFRTPMVVLTLGSSNLEYILTVWKYKNVFWEFAKKSIFWPKRVLSVWRHVVCNLHFGQVSSFNCWRLLIWNIYSQCGNIKMCFGILPKNQYFGQKGYFQCGAMLSVICILDKFRPLTVDDF